MKIYTTTDVCLCADAVVALGCFDGVHLAHREVISKAVEIARDRGYRSVVWCFSEPPKNTYAPTPVKLISDFDEKAMLIRQLGVDDLVMPAFTRDFAKVSAESFVNDILVRGAGAKHLVCGKNYTFGYKGQGDVSLLYEMCQMLGVGLTVVDDVTLDGVGVSSTLVREAVECGQLLYAARLLGRDFSLVGEGVVTDGDNTVVTLRKKLLVPPCGTYFCQVCRGARKTDGKVDVRCDEANTYLYIKGIYEGKIRVVFRSNRAYKDQ